MLMKKTKEELAEPRFAWKDPLQGLAVAEKAAHRAAITANVLQTNKVDAQCDKLATELSQQRFASKFASLQLPHLYLTYLTCICCLRWG